MSRRLSLADFDYALPPGLIAQAPAKSRAGSRMLHVAGAHSGDLRFVDLPGLLRPSDLLVFNDTRVINARIRGRKPTGGDVEMLIERIEGPARAVVQLKASHPPKIGGVVLFPDGVRAVVRLRDDRFFTLDFDGIVDLEAWLARHGDIPLPPYITRPPDASDAERYQTIYARNPGAVAAPTAGLHFDEAMLQTLARAGIGQAFVTLHVGAGTFQPVTVDSIADHRMHVERYDIPPSAVSAIAATKVRGGRVVAVGTTSLRALEAAAGPDGSVTAGRGTTSLFITPGYAFRVVDCLLTNFHMPRSTLLMLVSAFGGFTTIRHAYMHAIRERYRFMSYGDAMFVEREGPNDA